MDKTVLNTYLLTLLIYSSAAWVQPENMTVNVPDILLKQVENGDAESAYFIGTIFKDGTDEIEPQAEQAEFWFNKGAEMGHAFSMYEFAEILFDKENYQRAYEWYQQASEQGHGESFYKLAYYPMYGYNDTQLDCHAAYELLDKARLRNVRAAFNDQAWMLSTLPESTCRSGEKAWRIYSELEALYGQASSIIPWAYWDTKAAVLAEISEFNAAIRLQKWIVEENCELSLSTEHDAMRQQISEYLKEELAERPAYCQSFTERLQVYLNRSSWREAPPDITNN